MKIFYENRASKRAKDYIKPCRATEIFLCNQTVLFYPELCYNVYMNNTLNSNELNPFGLPYFFKPILWSFDFETINPHIHQKSIVVNAINYGDLKHWKWIREHYTLQDLSAIFNNTLATEFRPSALKLASIIFKLPDIYHV